MSEKLTKKELAEKLGISRPTLDKYLIEGFPNKIKMPLDDAVDKEYKKIILENEIRLKKYELRKLEEQLKNLLEEQLDRQVTNII